MVKFISIQLVLGKQEFYKQKLFIIRKINCNGRSERHTNKLSNRFSYYADYIIEWKILFMWNAYLLYLVDHLYNSRSKIMASETEVIHVTINLDLSSNSYLRSFQTNCHTNQAWSGAHVCVIDRIEIAYFTHFFNIGPLTFAVSFLSN